jgi:AraC family cel operon transcriptional repressor
MRLQWQNLAGRLPGCHVARVVHGPNGGVGLHDHDFAEFFWVEAGEVLHQTDTDNQTMTAGMGMLIAPTVHHRLQAVSTVIQIVNTAVPPQTWQRWLDTYGSAADWPWESQAPQARTMPADLDRRFEHFLSTTGDTLAVDAFVLPLLRDLRPDPLTRQLAQVPPWLAEAIRIASTPHGLRQGIQAMVDASGRSREHCARSIRRHLDCSPSDVI